MASYNKTVLVGNLTRDPDIKRLDSGLVIASLGLAVNDRVKRNNEWVDEVCFIDITYFGKTAEVCEKYLSKGSQILVEGKLRLEQWEKDGVKRSRHTVTGDRLVMLGSKGENSGPASSASSRQNAQPQAQAQDDLTPF